MAAPKPTTRPRPKKPRPKPLFRSDKLQVLSRHAIELKAEARLQRQINKLSKQIVRLREASARSSVLLWATLDGTKEVEAQKGREAKLDLAREPMIDAASGAEVDVEQV